MFSLPQTRAKNKNVLLCFTVSSPRSPRPLLSSLFFVWLPQHRPFSSLCTHPLGRKTTLKKVLPVVDCNTVQLRNYSLNLRHTRVRTCFRSKFIPLSITIFNFMVWEMHSFSIHCDMGNSH